MYFAIPVSGLLQIVADSLVFIQYRRCLLPYLSFQYLYYDRIDTYVLTRKITKKMQLNFNIQNKVKTQLKLILSW